MAAASFPARARDILDIRETLNVSFATEEPSVVPGAVINRCVLNIFTVSSLLGSNSWGQKRINSGSGLGIRHSRGSAAGHPTAFYGATIFAPTRMPRCLWEFEAPVSEIKLVLDPCPGLGTSGVLNGNLFVRGSFDK